jgi:hypothetical protein
MATALGTLTLELSFSLLTGGYHFQSGTLMPIR